jgi:hypothetical protein
VIAPHPTEDISIFASYCVFIRSVYLLGKLLFELSTNNDKDRMARTAGIFFGDLNKMFVEYVILQVCKITDPAQDARKNDNHTASFLLEHYNFDSNSAKRLHDLNARLLDFRQRVLPARHKLISHSDRTTILAGAPLGVAPQREWDQFWCDLDEFICVAYENVSGISFHINEVGMLSDAEGLLKALKFAACFEELLKDPSLTQRCADLAFAETN